MNKGLSIFAAASLLSSCAGETLKNDEVYLDSRPDVCTAVGQHTCLRVKHSEEQQWTWHYGQIAGFDYNWGYAYTLTYAEREVEDPPADAADTEWVLLEVVSRREDEVGAEYAFDGVNLLESTITYTDGEFAFLGQPFSCAEGLDCDTLLMLSGSEQDVDLEFRYLGDSQVELVSWQ